MTERCRCGGVLIAGLAFCVTCGDRRPEPAGAAMVAVGRRPGATLVAHPSLPPTPVAHPSLPPTPIVPPARLAGPPARPATPWIVGGAAIAVMAVIAALFLLALRPATPAPVAAGPSTVVVPSTTTVTAAPEAGSTTGSTSGSTTGSGSPATGTASLTDQVDTDRAAVETLAGRWIPQLSSKRVGTVADGITYGADDILGHYRSLGSTYPDVKLLYSGDWPVFNGADYWVVVVAQPFSTPAGANAWCSAHGFARTQCFAKQLSHSGGPAGTTVQR